MKKLKLFFALFAMLALGVGNAWGAVANPYVHTFASGEVKTTAQAAKVLDGVTWSISSATYVGFDGTKGVQIGSGKKPQNTTAWTMSTPISSFGENIQVTKVEIAIATASSGGVKYTITAGDQNATATLGATTSVTTKSLDCSANPVSTGTLTISLLSTKSKAVYIKSVKVIYETVSGSGETVVKTLKSIEVTPKTINYETGDVFKFDGTCTATYSVTKNDETQDDEFAVVTPTTVSTPDMSTAGKKEITVTYTEDGVTVDDTYEINVTENVVTPGTYTGNLNNVFFGCATGNNAVEQSGKFDDVLVVAGCKSSASDKTNYQSGHVRFYKDSYLQLSVPAGYVIKSIVFTAGGDWKGSITASAGTYTDGTKTWTGNAQEVKFSFAAQNRIKSVQVTYVADVKYALNITAPTNGTLVVKEGSTVLTDGALVYEGTKLVVTPTPNAGYVFESLTVDGTPVDLTEGSYTFNMPAADVTISVTFKENEKPAATLTLSKNKETEDITGYKQDDKVELPSITSDCVKAFVGWSADDECATEPEYKAGDEYTLASTTQTLYAVYATVGGGGEATAANTLSSNGWANESKHTSLQIDENVKATVAGKDNSGKYYNSGTDWRLYQSENATITISTTVGELKSVKFTFASEKTGTLLYNGTKLTSGTAVSVSGTSAIFTVGNSTASVTNGQIRISKIEVVYTGGVSYSNYSTTCAAALANPTFSLAAGKYTEAKSVTISAAEGTVYYTTDGTTPTASSTQYTGAIALNDCGEYTIKAIAISADSQSDVVSATYTIKLPLTNSQAAPYTEAEAIAVYDGDCYDNQDVYVKGTVKTATFYSSSSTYTITLTNGFQFYKFYKDGSKTLFADGEINKGDVLVACGKLSKYNTTYQLAEGCYLVEHEPYTEPKTDISNTEATAYTVDKAFALIADVSSDLTKEVYVKGLVAVAPTSNPTADGQMTYKISDNGENTGNVLTVYLGLNLNGEKFTSKNDVQQGDYVVVKGKLLDYNSTYELNKGNQLVQHVKAATISIADITMEVGETKTIAATITPDAAKTEVAYSIKAGSDDCITLSDNNITAKAEGTATIVATIATAAEYMGKTVEFKVTVTPVNITILPFAFDGGVDDIATTPGMSQKNLGNDYTSADSPKLKFDNTDDNVIIHFDSEPVELSFTLKQNGDNGATYTVYESEDGNTFSPVWVAGEIGYGKTQDVTVSLSDAARYVKFEYTNKIQGTNYALGKISITNTYSTPTTLSGKFSTGEYEYAEFATGNLQYKKEGENETWRFAKQQYQVVGDDNINVGDPAFEGWIDMFGWSTSETNYGVDPRNENVYYDGAFVDWSNLFPGEGWSTLSADQWKYLLNTRPNASSLKQIARVGSVVGIMLFPDNWNAPLTVTAQRDSYFDVDIHNYTLDQWAELEEAGALFLPAAGRRAGGYGNMINYDQQVETNPENLNGGHYKHQDNTNIYCYYWTSTINEDKNVSYLHNIQALGGDKYTIGTGAVWGEKGRYGQSVRLAKVTKQYYTREVDPQYYGTICLAKAAKFEGGSLYEVSYFDESTKKVYFDEIENGVMEAGMPYVFLAEKNVICAYYTSDTEESAQDKDGLYGTLVDITSGMNADGVYMIYRNQIIHSTNPDSYLNANRAYIKLTDVPGYNNPLFVAPAPVPGRKRISMGTQATNTATGVDEVQGNNVQSTKVLMDGTLYIFRNGKMYDAQGKLVK